MTVASEQKATTRVPSTVPTAASMPESSSGVISSQRALVEAAPRSRVTGLRGSCSRGQLPAWPGRRGGGRGGRARQTLRKASGDVVAAEAEGVVERGDVARGQVALLGGDVELTGVLGVVEVDRRRHDAVVQRQHRGDRLQRAGGAEQVAGHRLGGGDDHVGRRASPSAREHQRLGDVALRGRGGVRVDVRDVAGVEVGLRAARIFIARVAPAGRVGLGDVVGVGGDAGARDLGVHPGAAGLGVLLGLEDQRRRRPRRARSRRGPCPTAARRWLGSSLRLDSAIIWRRPPSAAGGSAASVPPATTTSARPSRIMSMPSAIASLPDAQAETGVCTPALAPIARPSWRRGRSASASGSPAARPGAGPSP